MIHSNLSAVYAALHEWTAALTHGQVCVSLKPDFAKVSGRLRAPSPPPSLPPSRRLAFPPPPSLSTSLL